MTHENEGGIEVLVILLDIVHIVLGCLLLVYRVEVETGVVLLDGLEEYSESFLETARSQRPATRVAEGVERTTSDRSAVVGILSCPLHHLRCLPLVVACGWISVDVEDSVDRADVDTMAIGRGRNEVWRPELQYPRKPEEDARRNTGSSTLQPKNGSAAIQILVSGLRRNLDWWGLRGFPLGDVKMVEVVGMDVKSNTSDFRRWAGEW